MNIEKVKVGSETFNVGLPNIYINSKGNFNIETSTELGNTSKGKINIESMDDIQIKPGDDIILYSHHRAIGKQDEVAIKVTDGDDIPVKLQVNAANITLTTKDKPTGTKNESEILDLNINTGKSTGNSKGYLKVRARAIDLRCEEHGGIALQPKGNDGSNHMNKIKFEHGGGDGLEFGTFNTEISSLFTGEYRFNRDGVVKMATRSKVESDKKDLSDETTYYKYEKQLDDFYDIISQDDEQTTWHDIIKTAYALNHREADDDTTTYPNGVKAVETSISSKGNLEIATKAYTQGGVVKTPNINIESAGKLALKGKLDFGSTFDFGETETGIVFNQKNTAKGAMKACDKIQVVFTKNSTTSITNPDGSIISVPAFVEGVGDMAVGESKVVAQCSMYDIIKFVVWAKNNNFGPWETQSSPGQQMPAA